MDRANEADYVNAMVKPDEPDDKNVILNPTFEEGINNWSGRGCKIAVYQSLGKVVPEIGTFFASATQRLQPWNGIQQDITGKVQRKLSYSVSATVRIFGSKSSSEGVRVTLWVQSPNLRDMYISIVNAQASETEWTQLEGRFLLNAPPLKAVIYVEGPAMGTDILLNSLSVWHTKRVHPPSPPHIENRYFNMNIIENSNLEEGTKGWFPLGNCTLTVGSGSPLVFPPTAQTSLGPHEPPSGRQITVSDRTHSWMGPAQTITDRIVLFLTYQVSAWARIPLPPLSPQSVNIALSVDGRWVNGGQIEIDDTKWHELSGSFRLEKKPEKVTVYVQGPDPGTNFMLASLQIFAVDRRLRFRYLNDQIEKVRKRDVLLKVYGPGAEPLPQGSFITVRQRRNSFPLGSCISRTDLENEDLVRFFLEHFNWAVFGNELKWSWTEPEPGKFNYSDADELLDFCERHGLQCRGHCIFWEVESAVQGWVKSLDRSGLQAAVRARLSDLILRYKGRFKHYDVNNEILHGSFYRDRLGDTIYAEMFKEAARLDPSPLLFVNDYHVEDGRDPRSAPEAYTAHILQLQRTGAAVGGVGIQGHIDAPVGAVVGDALSKMAALGIPIWFTEMDVVSENEHVRADDIEVMLREIYACPAVKGVVLWGFWEILMGRKGAHLVDAEGRVNEAGRRLDRLRKEWLSAADGPVDGTGGFGFRGFYGTYVVEIRSCLGKVYCREFEVVEGSGRLTVDLFI